MVPTSKGLVRSKLKNECKALGTMPGTQEVVNKGLISFFNPPDLINNLGHRKNIRKGEKNMQVNSNIQKRPFLRIMAVHAEKREKVGRS